MQSENADRIREAVRDSYGEIARGDKENDCGGYGCCNVGQLDAEAVSSAMGYTPDELAAVPEGANLGLGCGNPQTIAAFRPGETVIDLGSGAGFDCFLAARAVGDAGHVIGVDMTDDMLEKARAHATKTSLNHVEFRKGHIEALPIEDNTADVVMSNCVINLSPEKGKVMAEIFRVLKPGGRVAISDVVATAPFPQELQDDLTLYSGCITGAETIPEMEKRLRDAGFEQVTIKPWDASKAFIKEWAPGRQVEDYVVSAAIEGVKPSA